MDNALARGIVSTAQSIGMDPVDLATIISYETGGTFSPTQAGPTTQWGQHKGLIQFGEPQARQYGVDWNDPLGSQLGPDGAVARYFRSAGFEPGMGILDAYSAVNAGRVGRYNASDANNGGAPGTVRDKVEKQMGGHRAKAEAMLAGYAPHSEGPPVQQNALAGPMASGSMPPMPPAPPAPPEQPQLPQLAWRTAEITPYQMQGNALAAAPRYDTTGYLSRRNG